MLDKKRDFGKLPSFPSKLLCFKFIVKLKKREFEVTPLVTLEEL